MPEYVAKRFKTLLVMELILGFGPLLLLLAIGLLFSVYQVIFLMLAEEVRDNPSGSLELIGLSIFGLLSAVRFINVAQNIIRGKTPALGSASTIVLAVIGALILAYLVVDSDTVAWRVFFIVPLLVASHFVYLGRDSLQSGASEDDA